MFNLESKIQAWRKTMQAAGVTDEAVLRELESHLREDFTRILHSSSTAEPAFAEAVANLGQPTALKQEFDRAEIVPQSRIKRLLFPTNLRYYAIAALVVSPILFLQAAQFFYRLTQTFEVYLPFRYGFAGHFAPLAFWKVWEPMQLFLGTTVAPVLGVVGPLSAIAYLRRGSRASALCLAGFFCAYGWWRIYGMVWNILRFNGLPSGRVYLWGFYYYPFQIQSFSFTAVILGGMAFYFWRRELLGIASHGKRNPPRESETA